MSLKQQMQEALNRFQQEAANGEPQPTELSLLDRRLRCTLVEADRLACAVDGWTLQSARLRDATVEQLRKTADEIASRLNYLLEPIATIEVDEQARVVQMRSSPPHRDDSRVSYYELELRPGEVRLCRYAKATGQERERIPATITQEVLFRLVNDLATFA